MGYPLNLQNKMATKLTFNENTYQFHYYEPDGKPAFNIQKNGEPTEFNLIWDDAGEGNDEVFSGFNIYKDIDYKPQLLSTTKLKSPFSLIDVLTIFKEIKLKTGINL